MNENKRELDLSEILNKIKEKVDEAADSAQEALDAAEEVVDEIEILKGEMDEFREEIYEQLSNIRAQINNETYTETYITPQKIAEYIKTKIETARQNGEKSVFLSSRNICAELNILHRPRIVCKILMSLRKNGDKYNNNSSEPICEVYYKLD